MALPAGFVLVEPEKNKLPAGYALVSDVESGKVKFDRTPPEPTLSPEEQMMGAIGAPSEGGLASLTQTGPKKPPTELAMGEELGKGVGAGAIGLKSMWENAGLMKDIGAMSTVQQRQELFNKIDSGEITSPDQLRGLDMTTGQARAYLASDPAMREKLRERNAGEIGRRTDFVKASLSTIDQYQKDAEKYKGRTTDLTDVEGVKDFANWLSYNVGSGAVQMAPIMIAAATTGGLGVAALGAGMGTSEAIGNRLEFLQDKIKDLPPDQKAATVIDYIKKTGDTSLAVGIISGAMDSVLGPAAALAKRGLGEVVKGETRKQALKQGIKELPKQMGEEFLTGGAQEATQIAGAVREKEQEKFLTEENLKKILNSAAAEAAGAVGGGGMSTAARVYGADRATRQREQEEAQKQKLQSKLSEMDELIKTAYGEKPAEPPAAPPNVPPAPPAPPAAPAAAVNAPASEAMDTQAMLEELINSVNTGAQKAPETKVEKPAEATEEQAPQTIKVYRGHRIGEEFKSADDGNLGAGFYTTESEQAAKEFASRNKNGAVLQGELNAKRILDMDKLTKEDIANLKRAIPTTAEELQAYGIPYYDEATNELVTEDLQKIHSNLNRGGFEPRKLSDALPQGYTDVLGEIYKEAGYDAITRMGDALKSGTKYKEYVTFSPESQKLLTPKAKEAPEELAPDEEFGIPGKGYPHPEEFVEAKGKVDEAVKAVNKMRTKSGSLWSALTGSLNPEEVREIFGKNPNLGQRKLQITKGNGDGAYIVDMVDNGNLDVFLPPHMRHDSNVFDAAASAQYIKDLVGNQEYLPFDVEAEIKTIFDSVEEAERLVKEYLTEEEQNRELQIAADEQREIDQEAAATKPSGKNRPTGTSEAEEFKLTAATPDEIKAKQAEAERLAKEEERAKKAAEEKAKADEQAGEFTLTGSDREADVAAARGQKDIFAEAPKAQTEQERVASMTKKEYREDKETLGKADHKAMKMEFKGQTPKGLIEKYGEKDVRFMGRLFDIDVKDKFNVAKKLIAIEKGLSLVRGKTKADFDKMNKEMLGGYLEAIGQSKFGRKYEMVERLLKYEASVMGKFNDNLQDLKHKAAILNEARAGKPISEEVLKDYPDVAAYTLPRGSDGYKAAIRTLAVKSLPTLGMDTPATIAAYREDAKTTKDPLEKYVAADIADYMEDYYQKQYEKRNELNAKIEAAQEPTMTSMASDLKRVKEDLAKLEKAEEEPKDNKAEIAELRKEQKTLMREIIKAGLQETPEQEARMAEISKRLDELEGRTPVKPAEKPEVKQRSVKEIREELQDLEDQAAEEFNKDKKKQLASDIYKLQGELARAEAREKKAAAEEKPQSKNKLDDPAEFDKALQGYEDAYGNPESALSELNYYKNTVDSLIKKGGSIYRVIFAKSENDIDEKNLGNYWTIHSSNIDRYIGNLGEDAGEDTRPYVIEAKVPPNSVSNEKVDIHGNPDEEEVNIVANQDDIAYTVHEYNNKQVGPAIRELGKEEPTEEPEAPEGTVATPDGAVLRYPLAVSLVGDGYKVLALDDPRTYKDKGGEPHRTFEKGPLRIAMTPQRVLFQNRNTVNIGFGNPDQVTLEALMVDPGKRNTGLATKGLQDVIDSADKSGITLYLEPAPIVNVKKNDFGLDRDQLVDFYRKFGFEFQEDSNKVMQRTPEVEVLPAEEPQIAGQIENEPYTFEGQFTEIGDEEQRTLITDQSSKLSGEQIGTLEEEYGAKNGSDEFFEKLRADVIAYVTQGAKAVHGKIRAIIRQVANGVLSVAIVFNPQFVSKPYTIAVPQYDIRTSEVIKELPKEAQSMSDAAKRAYGVIYPTLEAELKEKNKLFIVADKQSANTYIFQPDGSLLLQSKTLFGAGIGDFMKGDNNIVANRITPAGLFDLGMRDAKRSASEEYMYGDYDFGKVFVLDKSYMGRNGPYSQLVMHSVWTNEKDAKQRLAALDKPGAEDSRYSFGCINVNKETFRNLITNHLGQMDGAKIFIVPENGSNVMDFVNGKATYSEDIIRQRVTPVTKTTKTEKQRAAPKVEERTMAAKEEEPGQYMSLEPQTKTQAFKKWFGDSQVVNEDGSPKVVYHGTIVRPDTGDVKNIGNIMAFDRLFTTQFRAPSIDTIGSFFTTNPSEGGAQMYSGMGEGAAIYPVYLSIKNPYTTTFEMMLRRARIQENGVDDGRKIGAKEVEALRRFLKETGRDGIHIKADPKSAEFKDQDVWIALEPEQIKSATGNRGTFDESGNIKMSLGDDMVRLVNQIADSIDENEKKRSPSFKRKTKTLTKQRNEGKLTDQEYQDRMNAAIEEDEENQLNKEVPGRVRGADFIRQKLLEYKRKKFITQEASDLAEWFINQNPALVEDLGIGVAARGPEGAGGFYNANNRIINLIKGGGSNLTATHEILHHLERMMPAKIQNAIRKAWLTQLMKANKEATNPAQKLYLTALLDAHIGNNNHNRFEIPKGAEKIYEQMVKQMKFANEIRGGRGANPKSSALAKELLMYSPDVPGSFYEYFDPSEFWAVNGSDIVQARYDAVQGGTLAKLKNWLREFTQKVKSLLGMKSDASIIRALDSLAKADGKFVTKEMLGTGDYQSVERRNYQGEEAPEADMEIPEMSFMDNMIYNFGDKHIDTKRLIESVKKAGKKIHEQFDAYIKEENYHGRLAKRVEDFLDDELRPTLQEMQDQGVTLDEVEKFLHNRHAKEANAYIASVNPELPDGGSGIKNEAADKYMADLSPEQRTKLESVAKKIDGIIKQTQKILVQTGLETQDTIDEWNKTYKHYVPLMRDQLDFVHTGRGVMGGFATRGSASKRRVGSEKPVKDIFANIAMQRERALRRSEQARVGRALYGMAIKHPNPGFWLAINPDAIKDKEQLEAELMSLGLKPEDAKNIIQEPKQPIFDRKTGLVRYQVNPLLRNSPNVFPVRINGQDRFIFFNPNEPRALRMVEAMKNLDTDSLGDAIGAVGQVTRWIASVNTQYNIVFGGVNFLRDLGAANFNLSTTEIAGKEKEVRKHVLPALRAIYRSLRGKGATTEEMKEMQEWFERYQLAGGQTGYQNQFAETERKANIVEREMKHLGRGNVKKTVDAVFDWLSDYNDAIENAVRLSAFRVAVESSKLSEDKAASIAKNLTVNFNRKGAKTGLISALYAFFNAAVQGSARLIETLRGPSGKKIIYGGMALGAFQALALAMFGFDDDEPPEFVKDKNFILPIPFTNKKYLAIPYPLGFNIFPGLGRLATETMLIQAGMIRSRKGVGDKMVSAASLVFDAFNPLGGSGNPLLMILPTIADPFGAIYSNRDAFGRPIYKEDKGTAPTPGYERSRENASTFSKKLAEAINWATSPAGTQHTKGFFSPTADQIDYFIGQITGGVGREIMKAGEFIKSKAVTQEEVPAYKIPIAGRFYGEADSPAATRSRFYENVTEMAKHEHEIKGLRKDKQSPAEYIKANPEARYWQRANNFENQIVKLNKEKKALIEKDAPRELIKRKEDEILKKMSDFNNMVRQGQ